MIVSVHCYCICSHSTADFLVRILPILTYFLLFIFELFLSLTSVSPQFCGEIVSELDTFLPLAAACGDSSLLEVRLSFVEACGGAAFAIMARLQERALEVPSSAPMKNLPALLSTCIYVHRRLQQYLDRLKDPGNAAKV